MSRSVKAARTLTSPRQNIKSSTNDLLPSRSFHIYISCRPLHPTCMEQQLWSYRAGITPDLPGTHQRTGKHKVGNRKLALPRDGHNIYRCTSGRDSDLEAFSPNPSDGSFAPLAFQPGTYTKYLNLRFLSY